MSQQTNRQEDVPLNQKREQFTNTIRRQNRNQIITKRRNFSYESQNQKEQIVSSSCQIIKKQFDSEYKKYAQRNYTMNDFKGLVEAINSNNIDLIHYGVIGLRKLVSTEENPPIQLAIDFNLVNKLIEFLKQQKFLYLQLEACWALTNIASGTSQQCQVIVNKGGIPILVKLLYSSKYSIIQQAVWAIGNIAGDCTRFRDMVIDQGGIKALIVIITTCKLPKILKQAAWALSNLCRGNPLPKYQKVQTALPALAYILKITDFIDDIDVTIDCNWALSYFSDGQKSRLQKIIQTGVIPKLIQFLEEDDLGLVIPSLRTLGNIATGNQIQTEELLRHNILKNLQMLLDHEKKTLRKQTCWILSNIAAGLQSHVNILLQHESLILKLLCHLDMDSYQIKQQICWFLANLSYHGNPEIILNFYFRSRIIQKFSNLLDIQDMRMLQITLQCLHTILEFSQQKISSNKNLLAQQLLKYRGGQKIQKLQYHESNDIYKKANRLISIYFPQQQPSNIIRK